MNRSRRASLLGAVVAFALVGSLAVAPASARTLDDGESDSGLTAAASGAVTGRVLFEPTGGGVPIAADRGYVRFFLSATCCETAAAVASLTPSGTFAIASMPAGSYFVEFVSLDSRALPVREWFNDQRSIWNADQITIVDGAPFPFGDIVVEERDLSTYRLAGENRFDTARVVSELFAIDGADRDIVIVNGLDFPDALSAGPIATRLGGPLLMVTRDAIPIETIEELNRLDPLSITIVGGTGVVSSAVEAQLATFVGGPGNVTRLAGDDRFATSREVLEAVATGFLTEIFIATGLNYPDALAAVPAAGNVGGAVMLVNGAASTLDAASLQLIDQYGVPVTIVGGTGVVSAGIESQLQGLGVTVSRIAGTDRYRTAIQIAVEYFPLADLSYVASGFGFADALAIGPFAGQQGAPLYLSSPNCMPPAVRQDIIDGLINFTTLIGGTGVLSPAVASFTPCAA